MSVEIRELIIRAAVCEPVERRGLGPSRATLAPEDIDRIIDVCVRRVMDNWRRHKER